MVTGMAMTQKVTVTLPTSQVEAIRRLVATGESSSVSGFVQHAVAVALDDVAGWSTMLTGALEATGGQLTAEERDWADRIISTGGTDAGAAA